MEESNEPMVYNSDYWRDFTVHKPIFTPDSYAGVIPVTSMCSSWSDAAIRAYSCEEDEIMKDIEEHEVHFPDKDEYKVSYSDAKGLEQNHILKCLSIMKSELMLKCSSISVKNIECKMTPMVKKNIINAYKKLEMYGKKLPFVASFDEYGRRLSDEIRIDTMKGMDIKIVEPELYGEFYIEFKGIIDYPF